MSSRSAKVQHLKSKVCTLRSQPKVEPTAITTEVATSSACVSASHGMHAFRGGGHLSYADQTRAYCCRDTCASQYRSEHMEHSVCDGDPHVLGCALHDLHGRLYARAVQVWQLDLCNLLHRPPNRCPKALHNWVGLLLTFHAFQYHASHEWHCQK